MPLAESFELMYGTGGHGGPYWSLDDAVNCALTLLRGNKTQQRIYVVPRDSRVLSHKNAIRIVEKVELPNAAEAFAVRESGEPARCPTCNRPL